MLIKPPVPGSEAERLLTQFGRNPAVLEWLEQNRTELLELLSQIPEDTRLRQIQGAAVVLKELTQIFNRTPHEAQR